MADISKITTLDGITYDVKDATARSALVVATQSSNGLMSAQDKANLDALVAGGGSGAQLLTFTNVVVSSSDFEEDITAEYYPYSVEVPLTNVTSTMFPEVAYSIEQVISGIFAPIVESYNGGIILYSSDIPEESSITIPTIVCWKP